jgi:hypothetical protein
VHCLGPCSDAIVLLTASERATGARIELCAPRTFEKLILAFSANPVCVLCCSLFARRLRGPVAARCVRWLGAMTWCSWRGTCGTSASRCRLRSVPAKRCSAALCSSPYWLQSSRCSVHAYLCRLPHTGHSSAPRGVRRPWSPWMRRHQGCCRHCLRCSQATTILAFVVMQQK